MNQQQFEDAILFIYNRAMDWHKTCRRLEKAVPKGAATYPRRAMLGGKAKAYLDVAMMLRNKYKARVKFPI